MTLKYKFYDNELEDFEYEITDKEMASAIAHIIYKRNKDKLKGVDEIAYMLGIYDQILEAETTVLQDAYEEEYYDELKDYFEYEASEEYDQQHADYLDKLTWR